MLKTTENAITERLAQKSISLEKLRTAEQAILLADNSSLNLSKPTGIKWILSLL